MMAEQQKKWDEEDAEEGVLPGETQDVNGRKPEATEGRNAEATHEEEDGEEEDPNKLKLDLTLLVPALQKFHKDREDQAVQKGLQNMGKAQKKNTKFQDKAADAEREKKKAKFYWERMTTILSEQKRSVWSALDKALTKYYQMLVDRQNLIEETGLLNQQNEMLLLF